MPRFLHSPEGRILLGGLLLTAGYLASLAFVWATAPQYAPILGAMTALNVVVGRAGGMSFGYAVGLTHAVVIPVNIAVETIQVLILFPLFVLSWRHLLEIRALSHFMGRMRRAAEANRGIIHRYGILGLFFFVMMPFWMTGPVVGSILGFLIGLRSWVNMTAVLGGTYVAIGIWAILLHGLTDWAATYNRYALFGVVGAVAILWFLGRSLRDRINRT
jgi:uncharacterized membrane protein